LALVRRADGKLVVGGPVFADGSYDFGLERYDADGALDRTFGHDVPDL
jgi:hypothetical protein